MEGEEYAEAAKVYGSILNDNPKDPEALVGLTKSRYKWIDKSLIDVRMLRLSQQAASATDLLKTIIEREREWQFFPTGAVQYTQEEETKYAVSLIAAQTEAWQTSGHLLKARAYIEGYQRMFATPTVIARYEHIKGQVTSAAKNQCENYRASAEPSLPYFTAFAKRYCDSWGISFNAGFDVAETRASSLFKGIHIVATDMSGIPEDLYGYGRDALIKEFEASPWYDKDAQSTLLLSLKTGFSHEHKKTLEKAVHFYTVKVPYTAMVPQMRQIPHTTYQETCTGTMCSSIPITTYTTETYTVPLTRYRDDPRQFEYDRWRHVHTLAFDAELLSSIQGMDANASHIKKVRKTDTEHPHSVPQIGLFPDLLSPSNPQTWLEKQIEEAAHSWGRALTKTWIQTYCTSPDTTNDERTLTNYVFRCLRVAQDPLPSFAETWFKEKLGTDYRTAELWLGRSNDAPIPFVDLDAK
jgi:hypothetical protein